MTGLLADLALATSREVYSLRITLGITRRTGSIYCLSFFGPSQGKSNQVNRPVNPHDKYMSYPNPVRAPDNESE